MWQALTEPQAIVISGILTVLAAVAGVAVGAYLFGSRVRDLRGALDASTALVTDHRSQVEHALCDIREKLAEFETLFGTALEGLGQLRGSVGDIAAQEIADDKNGREIIRTGWDRVREALERIAADPTIDGRTRARYARIDRRNYIWLIDALAKDGRLSDIAEEFRAAVALWHKYRPNRAEPSAADVKRIEHLADKLIAFAPAQDGESSVG